MKPVAIHKAAIIPIHLKARVKADLNRDVRLGILEKVDINSPVKWLSCMLVTMKKDGSPRRIIYYKRLNNTIHRQTNINKSPFCVLQLVRQAKRNRFWTLQTVIIVLSLKKGNVAK